MKWVDGVFAMLFWWPVTDWNTVHCHIALYYLEIPDDPQTNDELYTFSDFLNQRTNLQFNSRNIAMEACQCVCVLLLVLLFVRYKYIGFWDIAIKWIF